MAYKQRKLSYDLCPPKPGMYYYYQLETVIRLMYFLHWVLWSSQVVPLSPYQDLMMGFQGTREKSSNFIGTQIIMWYRARSM